MARSCHVPQNSIHNDQTLDIFIKSMASLKMSILQIWITWASKITFKNLQLYSIKIKGSHAPCDVTCSRSMAWSSAPHISRQVSQQLMKHYVEIQIYLGTIVTVATEVRLQTVCKLDFPVLVQHRVYLSYKPIWYFECTGRVESIDANIGLFEVVLVSLI